MVAIYNYGYTFIKNYIVRLSNGMSLYFNCSKYVVMKVHQYTQFVQIIVSKLSNERNRRLAGLNLTKIYVIICFSHLKIKIWQILRNDKDIRKIVGIIMDLHYELEIYLTHLE